MNRVFIVPMLGMAALTSVVWGLAIFQRVREIRQRKIPLQSLAHARDVAQTFAYPQTMDKFNNLLQMPVLFYAVCLAMAHTPAAGGLTLTGCCL